MKQTSESEKLALRVNKILGALLFIFVKLPLALFVLFLGVGLAVEYVDWQLVGQTVVIALVVSLIAYHSIQKEEKKDEE